MEKAPQRIYKVDEIVVITDVNSNINRIYIGRVGRIRQTILELTNGETAPRSDKKDYHAEIKTGSGRFDNVYAWADVREATEMDKALEGL
jgi:hypothetical protein